MAQRRSTDNISSVIPKLVVDLLRKEDAIIGHLTDHHVKWLMMFSYTWFDTRQVTIAFDFHSTPKQIFVTPRTAEGGIIPFKKWMMHKIAMFKVKTEKDLPAYIGLKGFEIKFCRSPKEGTDVEEVDGAEEPASATS